MPWQSPSPAACWPACCCTCGPTPSSSGSKLLTALAQLGDEQTSRTLQNVEQGLRNANAILTAPARSSGPPDADEIDAALRRLAQDRPYLFVIRILDDRGHALYSSDTGYRDIDLSDRNYFKKHRDHPEMDFEFGRPIRNRVEGRWIIPATLGLRKADGTFAGLIVAGVDPLFFDRVWAIEKNIPKLSITLLRGDGALMMRSPFDDKLLENSYAGGAVFQRLHTDGTVGTFRNRSAVDGEDRLFAYRQLTVYPGLILIVGQSIDQGARCLVAAGLDRPVRLDRRHDRGDSAHPAAGPRMESAAGRPGPIPADVRLQPLSHGASRPPDPTLSRGHQAAIDQYGWSREEFLAMTSFGLHLPEDVPSLMAILSDSRPGEIVQNQRHRKKDGSVIDVEVALRPIIFNAKRAILALSHDVTERVATERARQIAETQLQMSQER